MHIEELRARRSLAAWMQVGEDRFNKEEINRLYDEGLGTSPATPDEDERGRR
jgi:hypothetical protein